MAGNQLVLSPSCSMAQPHHHTGGRRWSTVVDGGRRWLDGGCQLDAPRLRRRWRVCGFALHPVVQVAGLRTIGPFLQFLLAFVGFRWPRCCSSASLGSRTKVHAREWNSTCFLVRERAQSHTPRSPAPRIRWSKLSFVDKLEFSDGGGSVGAPVSRNQSAGLAAV